MNYLRQYKSVYGESYECVVPNHEELELLFQEKCNNYGILYRMSDIIQEYQTAYDLKQLSLFDFISECYCMNIKYKIECFISFIYTFKNVSERGCRKTPLEKNG